MSPSANEAGGYVGTKAIREAVKGRELDVLTAMGIEWHSGRGHIRCPYDDHGGDDDWRWDDRRKVAFCTCIGRREGERKAHSIFAVVAVKQGLEFEEAKLRVAEIIGRADLVNKNYQRTDPDSLLNTAPENRDDRLVWNYLDHRLGIASESVPRSTTKAVGIKSLAYFEPPKAQRGKPIHIGNFSCAVFEMVDRDDRRHAHRIYVAPGGAGKAVLGVTADGKARSPKKSAKAAGSESTDGRCVTWGDASKAETEIIAEGVETAAAIALAFQEGIASGAIVVASCITAGGIEAFKPWPSAKRVIVGADRDEASVNGRPPTRRGERAAREFAELHGSKIAVCIALPGQAGEKIDWLDVLRRDGLDAVCRGILAAKQHTPKGSGADDEQQLTSATGDHVEITRLARLSPLDYDREREAAADRLGCRVGTLDEQVKAARGETASAPGQGRPISLSGPEPWAEPVDGAGLLDGLSSTIREYVIVSDKQADAVALWSIHTHAHDASDVSPRLAPKSAQKRSGKTRLAEVLDRIVARPLYVSGIKPAALLRIIETLSPTLLLDEVDALKARPRNGGSVARHHQLWIQPGWRTLRDQCSDTGGWV